MQLDGIGFSTRRNTMYAVYNTKTNRKVKFAGQTLFNNYEAARQVARKLIRKNSEFKDWTLFSTQPSFLDGWFRVKKVA